MMTRQYLRFFANTGVSHVLSFGELKNGNLIFSRQPTFNMLSSILKFQVFFIYQDKNISITRKLGRGNFSNKRLF